MRRRAAVACLLLALIAPALQAAPVVIKMATLVPDGSVWDKALREMAAEWRRQTNGEVVLRIYPGGVAGDEEQVVRKMRIGSLHAGAMTIAGLSEIEPGFGVLGIPLFVRSYEELEHLLAGLETELAGRLEAKGYVFLNWAVGGWAHFFSTRPVRTVADLRDLKMYTWAGDQRMVRWWQQNGFRPVPLAMTDIMPGLQTGQIEVLATPPLAALSLQWFRSTPYMHDLGLGAVVGANVVSKRIWDRIPASSRPGLVTAARSAARTLFEEIPEQEKAAVEEMSRRGLTVTETSDNAEWMALADSFSKSIRGEIVPRDMVELAEGILREYRAREGSER